MSEWAPETWPHYAGDSLVLGAGEIHLWQLLPENDFSRFLPSHERSRYERMTHRENKAGYAMSQGGLRQIASLYLQRDWSEVEVLRHPRGKPYVTGAPEFNLSHTAGQVYAAFSPHSVGLDIESVDRSVHALELARRYFFPAEADHIFSQPETDRSALFLRYWVCKESTVKLSGDGIYHGLRDVRVLLGSDGWSRADYRGKNVHIREFRLSHRLMGAVAAWNTFSVKGFFRV